IFTATDRSAPMFVLCDREHTMSAIDPTGHPLAIEHATITGTLVCTNCKPALPMLAVTIGDARAQTDTHGRFAITVDARGALTLDFDLPASQMGWTPSSSKPITFRGKGSYSIGRFTVTRDCGPARLPCEH